MLSLIPSLATSACMKLLCRVESGIKPRSCIVIFLFFFVRKVVNPHLNLLEIGELFPWALVIFRCVSLMCSTDLLIKLAHYSVKYILNSFTIKRARIFIYTCIPILQIMGYFFSFHIKIFLKMFQYSYVQKYICLHTNI